MSQTKAQLIDNLVSPITGALGSASAPTFSFTADPNTGIYSPGADQVAISTNGTGRVFVDASGNVGAGIASPATRLHVSTNQSTVSTFQTSGADLYLRFQNSVSTGGYVGYNSNALTLWTTEAERLRITSAGRVGIGTSSPAELLELSATSDPKIQFTDVANVISKIGISASTALTFEHNGSERLRIAASGNVGIGTTSPGVNLDVASTTPTVRVNATGGGTPSLSLLSVGVSNWIVQGGTALKFVQDATERLRIDSSGKVGIGTTSPGELLSLSQDVTTEANLLSLTGTSLADGEKIFTTFKRGAVNLARVGAEVGGAGTTGQLIFETAISSTSTERARIDSSGRLLVGTSSAYSQEVFGASGFQPKIQVNGSSGDGISIVGWRNTNNYPGNLWLARSNSDTIGTHALVTNGQKLGEILFSGSDGTDFENAASIKVEVDGTAGADDMPGRLVFSTTADGAASPTERLRIDSSGRVGIGTSAPLERLHIGGTGNKALITPVTFGVNQDSAYLIAGSPSYTGTTTNWGTFGFQHRIKSNAGGSGRVTIDTKAGEAFCVTDNNLVGIGTTSPHGTLQVHDGTFVLSKPGGGSDKNWRFLPSDAAAGDLAIQQSTTSGGTTYATKLTIDPSGRVGIGSTSPGDYDAGGNKLVIADTTNSGITIRGGTSGQGAIYFADGTTGNEAYRGRIEYSHSNDSLNFGTAGTGFRVTLDSSGRLLVGTTSTLGSGVPSYSKFQLIGNTQFSNSYGGLTLGRAAVSSTLTIAMGRFPTPS
jgi:hypothetical protein